MNAFGCDIKEALDRSCARSGCHSALDHFGSLDLSNPSMVAAQMLDRQAPHTDINCAEPGTPYRMCTPDELAEFCPGSMSGVKLIDSANPEASWVLRKLNGTHGMCGETMPMAPGDTATAGWNDARKACLEQFFRSIAQEGRAAGGTGGMNASGGMGPAGAAGTAVSGAGGTAGRAPVGTGVGDSYVPLCDLTSSLKANCARTGCHGTADKFADLDLTNPVAIAAQLVDKPASHGDIGCNAPGTPFRECDAAELVALGCPTDALLIDSVNFENSWVLKKLHGEQGQCGDPMPIAPGDSVTNGWNAMRQLCYEDLFAEMARYAREQRGDP